MKKKNQRKIKYKLQVPLESCCIDTRLNGQQITSEFSKNVRIILNWGGLLSYLEFQCTFV